MRGLLEGSDNLKVRRGNVFTRILCLVKLFEFVFFNDAIIIYSEYHSPRLFAPGKKKSDISARPIDFCLLLMRIIPTSYLKQSELIVFFSFNSLIV